jgi:hypothetical protein
MNIPLAVEKIKRTIMDDTDSSWHLNKSVTVALISTLMVLTLALISFGISGIWAFADLRRDVDVVKIDLKNAREMQHDRDERQDRVDQDTINFLRQELATLHAKIDRLLELRQSDEERMRDRVARHSQSGG